jgi:hypothetical protein
MTDAEAPPLARAGAHLVYAMESGRSPADVLAAVGLAYEALVELQHERRGAMLAAVMADLDAIDVGKVPGGRTYRQTVLWLAEVIDKRGADDGPSTTAKLADQLTKVMQALTRRGGGEDDGYGDFEDAISTPVA